MSIEPSIFAALSAVAPTYPVVAPSGASLPRITYQLISGSDYVPLDGQPGTTQLRIQVDAWAASYSAAQALGLAARDAVYAAVMVGSLTYNPADFEVETGVYRYSFDVSAWS